MKSWIILFVVLVVTTTSAAAVGIYPQLGMEFYGGSNKLSLVTPWAGVRIGVSNCASVLVKYYRHNLRYSYSSFNEATETFEDKTRSASLSNFTSALYYQKGQWTAWGALSYFRGTDAYDALALDAGAGRALSERFTVEAGIYLLREDSILWYPEEAQRAINLYSLKAGLKVKIVDGVAFNPSAFLYRNSEGVNALSYFVGFVVAPKDPLYITLYYFKYSESASYKFSGDYFSVGLNLYY